MVKIEFVCVDCGEKLIEPFANSRDAVYADDIATEKGWVLVGDKWYCPDCCVPEK